jgi:hypothetical protein
LYVALIAIKPLVSLTGGKDELTIIKPTWNLKS